MNDDYWVKMLRAIWGEQNQKPPIPRIFHPVRYVTSSKKDLKSPLSRKWNPFFYRSLKTKLTLPKFKLFKRRIRDITDGLTMPQISSVPIGGAKRMNAAIMFFDLQDFTAACSQNAHENMLLMLNVLIPAIMDIVRHWDGEIEKNTGDGIMAIFGTETRNDFLIARDAIECAMTIRYLIVNDIEPKLLEDALPSLNFRIGIDMGPVLISRIGIKGHNFLTVVGGTANRASQLQQLAGSNGICIGENIYRNLNPKLHVYCEECKHNSWQWSYTRSKRQYKFFHYKANWPEPKEWMRMKF
jgi:adenylate cyclase